MRGGSGTPLPVTHGVPQGSIAGPILFSIFVNDLPCHLSCKTIVYADDTQLLDQAKPDQQGLAALRSRIQGTLTTMDCWFKQNSLKMNPNKTDIILTGTRPNIKKTKNFEVSFKDETLVPSLSTRLLGVTIDAFLSWEDHISQIVRKCNGILISLYRFRHHFSQSALKRLIEAHVFPHITYCLSAWGGANKKHLSRIQKILNFAARIVTGIRRGDRIGHAFETLGWHRIEEMVDTRDAIKMFKVLYSDMGSPAVREMFTTRNVVSSRSTRATDSGKLHVPRCKLENTKRFFRYRAAQKWNSLPNKSKSCVSLLAFKRALS